jgi:hypothetical protein
VNALLRYLSGYVLGFFRERVAADDFRDQPILRVLVTSDLDDMSRSSVRDIFPRAALHVLRPGEGLWHVRRQRFDAACVGMTGGGQKERIVALLSGARHKLLIPSPDYVYRLGMRAGWPALVWAVADRFVIAPFALLWFLVVAAWLYVTGLPRRALEADR